MVIDIINYTDEQFAALSPEQILEVKTAQTKKNALTKKLAEEKQEFRRKLVENGTFLSQIWALECARLDAEYEEEVTSIREALLFYLRFSTKGTTSSKYPVDYSLPMETRFYNVRDYYEATYTDPLERYQAFKADEVAKVYLGEYYAPLHDYFYRDLS
jgi:hypothetical protein